MKLITFLLTTLTFSSCNLHQETGMLPELLMLKPNTQQVTSSSGTSTIKSLTLFPNQINNLQLWLEGDALSLASGTKVASWTDKSANGFHATQGTVGQQPTFMDNLFNGKPGLRFTDGNPGTNLTLGANYLFSTNDGITIVAVGRSAVYNASLKFIFDFGGFAGAGYGLIYSATDGSGGNNVVMYSSGDVGGVSTQGKYLSTTSDIVLIIARLKFAPATDKEQTIHTNGSWLATNSSGLTLTQLSFNEICEFPLRGGGNNGATPTGCTNNNVNGPVTIGGQSKTGGQANRFFAGDIAMVLFYDKAITETERIGLECYASEKYGITISHGCTE
ncbi:MAG: hypothetical protein KDK36_00250 [Leptospiraceae bacterium]|nr:hypothetical protein [Leptospiraceae bacterium]